MPSVHVWWPIRNQIFVPFAAILIVAVTTITVFSAVRAARTSKQQAVERLGQVIETLGRATFPYAPTVLEQMRGLSGAHFVVCSENDEILAATLPVTPDDLRVLPPTRAVGDLSSLDQFPLLRLGEAGYLVAEVGKSPRYPAASLLVLYPENRWNQLQWEAAVPPLAVGAVTLILMLLASAWLAQRLARRIRRVERQVAAIAAGDFREVRLEHRHDEIQELVGSVNRMSAQLRQMQQTVRQTERSRLLGQLAGGLAHQLRNALTGARMAVQIHTRRCPSQGDESLQVALRQLSLTEEQVKGFLSLGRHESRGTQQCDVRELVAEVVRLVGPACTHARVELQHEVAASVPEIEADLDALKSAILNLTLNAIEAAGAEGIVALNVTVADGQVIFSVTDTGPGPPAAIAATMFEPFITSKPEGVGLGLAQAQQVAEWHGGSLTWQREADTTCFRFEVPVSRRSGSMDPSATTVASDLVERESSRPLSRSQV